MDKTSATFDGNPENINAPENPINDIMFNFDLPPTPRNISELKTKPLFITDGKRTKMLIPVITKPGPPKEGPIKMSCVDDPQRGITWVPAGIYYEDKELAERLFLQQVEEAVKQSRMDLMPPAKLARVLVKLPISYEILRDSNT